MNEEYKTDDAFYDDFDVNDVEKGVIMEVYNILEGELEYHYSPAECFFDMENMQEWEIETDKKIKQDSSLLYVRNLYWVLREMGCIKVPRDPKWFEINGPSFEEFWTEVEWLRANPDELQKIITAREERISAKKHKASANRTIKFDDFDSCMLKHEPKKQPVTEAIVKKKVRQQSEFDSCLL